MAAVEPAAAEPLLRTVGLGRSFGGLEAVRGVDFRVERGETRALIGPNGAGKTTLVNMISGRLRPTSGAVLFKGRNITDRAAHDRVRLGIVFTFQTVSVFKSLTVFENVAVSAQRRLLRRVRDHARVDAGALRKAVAAALAAVGMDATGSGLAGALPYGHQRLLEIAMALAAGPELLILDEPTQGLAPGEVDVLAALLRQLAPPGPAAPGALTILVIEHNMPFVLGLARRITVMDRGGIIAEGSPREIEANPDVRRVYLGV